MRQQSVLLLVHFVTRRWANFNYKLKMIQVYSAEHPTEAHYVKGLLESQGITCDVRGESLFGARGELPITTETLPSIWIFDDSKFTEARSVIKDYENLKSKETSDIPKWICLSCGEESEAQFTECWNCLTPRSNK